MKLFPIYIDGEIALIELARIFSDAGYALRTDAGGRVVAHRVPAFLRKDEPAANVVPMKRVRGGK